LVPGTAITGAVTDITDAGTTVGNGSTAGIGILIITGANQKAVEAGVDCDLKDSTTEPLF